MYILLLIFIILKTYQHEYVIARTGHPTISLKWLLLVLRTRYFSVVYLIIFQ